MKQRIYLLSVKTMTTYLLVGISATLMVQAQAGGKCADISGGWYATETVTLTCSYRGEKDTTKEKGGGFITMNQSRCAINYIVPTIKEIRKGTVDNNSLSMTGKFIVILQGRAKITKNIAKMKGVIKSGSLIKLTGEGVATGTLEGSSFSCKGTSTGKLTRDTADLVVKDVILSNTTPIPNLSFDVGATVKNKGTITSNGSKLHFYRSKDSKINTNDLKLVADEGVAVVPALLPGGELRVSQSVSIGSTGTFWVGACAKPVYGELTSSAKNCSTGIKVTVEELDFSIIPIIQPLLGH